MTFFDHALFRLRTARVNQLSVAFLLGFAMILGTVAGTRVSDDALDSDMFLRFTTQVGVVHLVDLAIQEVSQAVK